MKKYYGLFLFIFAHAVYGMEHGGRIPRVERTESAPNTQFGWDEFSAKCKEKLYDPKIFSTKSEELSPNDQLKKAIYLTIADPFGLYSEKSLNPEFVKKWLLSELERKESDLKNRAMNLLEKTKEPVNAASLDTIEAQTKKFVDQNQSKKSRYENLINLVKSPYVVGPACFLAGAAAVYLFGKTGAQVVGVTN